MQEVNIVRNVFADRNDVRLSEIGYKDTRSYFSVLYENKVTKWVCRFYFNSANNKFITLPSENGKDTRIDIDSINELYKYKKEINESLDRRISK